MQTTKAPSLKILPLLLSIIVVAGLATFTACDDSDDDGSKFEGEYKLTSATLTTAVTIQGGDMEGTELPVGAPITSYVSTSLFSVVQCDNADNAAIELSGNTEIHFICLGETGDTKGGSWTDVDGDLVLQLSSPPFTQNLSITVTNIEVNGNTLEGDIDNLPFAGELFGDPGTPVYLVDMHIVFTKQ
ncbi:MAG: hypothetical protein HC859_04555 [Bacteroidia bacterium]|nr:hypothetical protein [Bacteroidia bacterium]